MYTTILLLLLLKIIYQISFFHFRKQMGLRINQIISYCDENESLSLYPVQKKKLVNKIAAFLIKF